MAGGGRKEAVGDQLDSIWNDSYSTDEEETASLEGLYRGPQKRWSGPRLQPLMKALQDRLVDGSEAAASDALAPAAAVDSQNADAATIPVCEYECGGDSTGSVTLPAEDTSWRDLKTMYALVRGKIDVTCGANGRFGMTGHVQQVCI